jgi:hypothetical protein
MTWRKARLELPELDLDHEIIDRPGRIEPDGRTTGMRRRFEYEGTGAPPTAQYWYGSGGRRWAGKGRKAPLRNWKRSRREQWRAEAAS